MLVLVVWFTVQPGKEERCREIIRVMQEHTRKEPGCQEYVGSQSSENPRNFIFYEVYDDQAALDAHRAAAYYKQYVAGELSAILESRERELFQPV